MATICNRVFLYMGLVQYTDALFSIVDTDAHVF